MESKVFRDIFMLLMAHGKRISPRGLLCIEQENWKWNFEPYVRFCNFTARKLNIEYTKKEFLWYLKGQNKDLSILNEAKMWGKLVNADGTINSNYGHYIFGPQNQFDDVVNTLRKDKDSRRAFISILSVTHLQSITNDIPCTIGLNFHIRENKLNMTVHMRSQDAVFGMGNDLPAFSFMHEMMLNALREFYPDLEYGMYCHIADSFHVYERHFDMVENIINSDETWNIDCPKISGPDEVKFLRRLDFTTIPDNYEFTKWLTSSLRSTENDVQLPRNQDNSDGQAASIKTQG